MEKNKYQNILNRWSIDIEIDTILHMWNLPHRSYHNDKHLEDILSQIERDKDKYTIFQYDELVITAIFHDIIYDPERDDNEQKSADLFLDLATNKKSRMIYNVYQNILDTKDHEPKSSVSAIFIEYDMDILKRPFSELMGYEKSLRREYNMYSDDDYISNRLSFLKTVKNKYNNDDLDKLINWIKKNYITHE